MPERIWIAERPGRQPAVCRHVEHAVAYVVSGWEVTGPYVAEDALLSDQALDAVDWPKVGVECSPREAIEYLIRASLRDEQPSEPERCRCRWCLLFGPR